MYDVINGCGGFFSFFFISHSTFNLKGSSLMNVYTLVTEKKKIVTSLEVLFRHWFEFFDLFDQISLFVVELFIVLQWRIDQIVEKCFEVKRSSLLEKHIKLLKIMIVSNCNNIFKTAYCMYIIWASYL